MASLLVTKKMSPELAARVQASVEGRRAAPGEKRAPRATAVMRAGAAFAIFACAGWLLLSFQREKQHTAEARAALLERARIEARDLGAQERSLPATLVPWMQKLAYKYGGDFVSEGLRAPGALELTLSRPMVYVRGPIASFDSESGRTESALSSFRDAFVLCLLSPPGQDGEKHLRIKARAAQFAGSDSMKRTAHVARLGDAVVGLPYLGDQWQERVAHARSLVELQQLEEKFDKAPLAAAKHAAKAKLLLVVMDEPGDTSKPAELDGERAHPVRVALIDLAAQKLLLRLRRRVDPSGYSAATRAELAAGVDSCRLALDVRSAIQSDGDASPQAKATK